MDNELKTIAERPRYRQHPGIPKQLRKILLVVIYSEQSCATRLLVIEGKDVQAGWVWQLA